MRITALICVLLFGSQASAQQLDAEVLFDIDIEVAAPHVVGSTGNGSRAVYQVTGGRFVGPSLNGKVLNGADWALNRADGQYDLDVRLTLETDSGNIVYMSYAGFLTAPAEVFEALGQGGAVTEDQYYMRTTPRFETSSTELAWLNTTVFVGVGRITKTGVGYTVYRIR